MVMGLKHQLVASVSPTDIVHITLNHLDAIRSLAGPAPDVSALIQNAISRVLQVPPPLPSSPPPPAVRQLCAG
jgi:hypothetical protein